MLFVWFETEVLSREENLAAVWDDGAGSWNAPSRG